MRIVELLARGDLTAGEIAEQFTISRPAVSKHLRVLRSAGLVKVTADANRRIYCLEPRPLSDLAAWLESQWTQWEQRLDALGEHLDAKERMGTKGDN